MAFNNILPAELFIDKAMKKQIHYEKLGMLMEDYQAFVESVMTDKVKGPQERIHWATDELIAEAGEVKGVLAKARRKYGGLTDDCYTKLEDELGDTLWGLMACCIVLGIPLARLMEDNMAKLQERWREGISYNETTKKT